MVNRLIGNEESPNSRSIQQLTRLGMAIAPQALACHARRGTG
jgi:hypothetical protein